MLGGVDPEELVKWALSALEQGLSGIALQQIAGLSKPTKADLGNLPERAFAELGLKPIDNERAVDILLARGEPTTCVAISSVLTRFPISRGDGDSTFSVGVATQPVRTTTWLDSYISS